MSGSRREFLQVSTATAALAAAPYIFSTPRTMADETKAKNDRMRAGCIGNGGMGRGDGNAVKRYADILANCDVDTKHAEQFKTQIGGGKSDTYSDYRKLLDRKDIDVVTISTPDHWHTKIAIDAMRAGKDVYCQKPLTLTIDEGKLLCKVAKETKRVFQVGTQQRSEDNNMFLKAVALAQGGRLGKLQRVEVAIGGGSKGGPFKKEAPPENIDWDRWLGQTPKVDYIAQRCHGSFRWWYEYSGGKLTDWGAHHVDIATWALGLQETGPEKIEVILGEHPVPFAKGYPTVDDSFNTATKFKVQCTYANGLVINIRDACDDLGFNNGLQIFGDKGSIFVNRGKLTGEAVTDLAKNPLPEGTLEKLRHGKRLDSHMGNFIECVRDRSLPVSDVFTHHRALSTCHLANIALRLNRTLKWDPTKEEIVGDAEANAFLKRDQRKGYEVA